MKIRTNDYDHKWTSSRYISQPSRQDSPKHDSQSYAGGSLHSKTWIIISEDEDKSSDNDVLCCGTRVPIHATGPFHVSKQEYMAITHRTSCKTSRANLVDPSPKRVRAKAIGGSTIGYERGLFVKALRHIQHIACPTGFKPGVFDADRPADTAQSCDKRDVSVV